jgi:Polyferredoxin
MRPKHLKALRVGVSVMFFALIALVFLDFGNLIPPAFTRGLLYLQFIPSLLQFLNGAGLGLAGWVVVLALTAFFGRIYCSTVCPLGTLQDIIGFAARKRRKGRGLRFVRPDRRAPVFHHGHHGAARDRRQRPAAEPA